MTSCANRPAGVGSLEQSILLVGPPNVGKSIIFNRLTGLNVSVANYVGTTVDYMAGYVKLGSEGASLIDVPGTYTLEASNEAEKVAVQMLCSRPAAVVFVIDANDVETSVHLLLQVLEFNIPTVAVVNRVDIADGKGLVIDVEKLSQELGITVIPTVAIKGRGINELRVTLQAVLAGELTAQKRQPLAKQEQWTEAERLTALVTKRARQEVQSPLEAVGQALVRPWPGLPLAILILAVVFGLVVGLGMLLRQQILLPIVRGLIIPRIIAVVDALFSPGIFREVLVGEFGFLVKGLEWPLTLVLPYVLSFYFTLSVLEDSGYLPRLAVLLDGLLNKIGVHGSNVVPLLLGYGCGIPGILATRAAPSAKERIMISTMICIAVPCVAQTGAFISLLAAQSMTALLGVMAVSVAALVVAGLILDRVIAGPRPVTVMELPPLLMPEPRAMGKKVWARLRHYLADAVLPVVFAVAVASVLYETGLIVTIGSAARPLVTGWLNLPQEAAVPLMLGIFRRELTVLPLLDMDLTNLQLFVGAVVGLFYVPCAAMIAVMAREFGLRIGIAVLVLTTGLAFFFGGIVARVGAFVINLI